MQTLKVRKLADTRGQERVVRYDPETGERRLVNPATGRPEPWPLLGVVIDGDTPAACDVPTSWVDRGRREGWIVLEGERAVVRPGGPPENPYLVDATKGIPHVFVHADAVVLKLMDGDVRYRVVHQPDKYHDGPAGTDAVGDPTARCDHFYGLELEG